MVLGQSSSSDTSSGLGVLLILGAIGLGLYFVPAIIGFSRNHPQKVPIAVLNLLAGWTFIGWVGALVWAFVIPQAAHGAGGPTSAGPTRPCPFCAEPIQHAASVCKHCGRDVQATAVPVPFGYCVNCGAPPARPPTARCLQCGSPRVSVPG